MAGPEEPAAIRLRVRANYPGTDSPTRELTPRCASRQEDSGAQEHVRSLAGVCPPRFCGLAGPGTQAESGGSDRIVEKRGNSSTNATRRAAVEMGAADSSSGDRPDGNRQQLDKFIGATLRVTGATRRQTLPGGNWSLRELVERLEQVGAQVEIERERGMAEPVMRE